MSDRYNVKFRLKFIQFFFFVASISFILSVWFIRKYVCRWLDMRVLDRWIWFSGERQAFNNLLIQSVRESAVAVIFFFSISFSVYSLYVKFVSPFTIFSFLPLSECGTYTQNIFAFVPCECAATDTYILYILYFFSFVLLVFLLRFKFYIFFSTYKKKTHLTRI